LTTEFILAEDYNACEGFVHYLFARDVRFGHELLDNLAGAKRARLLAFGEILRLVGADSGLFLLSGHLSYFHLHQRGFRQSSDRPAFPAIVQLDGRGSYRHLDHVRMAGQRNFVGRYIDDSRGDPGGYLAINIYGEFKFGGEES
jgi:hypothetical protein